MSSTPLTIWTGAQFSGEAHALLAEGVAPHRLVFSPEPAASVLTTAAPDPALATAEIAFGQPPIVSVLANAQLRWVHLTSAGYTRYDHENVREALQARGAMLSNSSSVYDEPCAEHALAFLMAHARQLLPCYETQRTDRGWPTLERRADCRLLAGQRILLLGFGAIGRRLAELLRPFAPELAALKRQAGSAEGVRLISEAELEPELRQADHVISLLPENPSTLHFINAARLAAMKPGAVFYNIGRGSTVDQDALLQALRGGRLATAYLDVTSPEPLPPEHPLWAQANCFITPHSAGGHEGEDRRLVEHFLRNLRLFLNGEPLRDRVI